MVKLRRRGLASINSEIRDGIVPAAGDVALTPGAPEVERGGTRAYRVVALIIACALFMEQMDATVLATALPTMARDFGVPAPSLSSALTAYLLALAIFIPASGRLADRFGSKTVFRLAIIVFVAGSVLCGQAANLEFLIFARFLQGMGGAMMIPIGRLVLLRTVAKQDMVSAMSWLIMPALIGPILGPPIGGFIVTYGSWRWIFFLNIPIAILGLFLVSRFIKDVKEEGAAPPLDWPGLFLTGLGMAGVVYGFENLGKGVLPATVVAGMMSAGLICLGLYVLHARRTPHAILDISLLKTRTFRASVVGGAFMRMGMGASPFLLALLLQVAFGLSALQAGLMTFASAAAALVMKTAAPPILARFGFKTVLSVNAVIVGVTFMAYALFTPTTPHWMIYAVLLTGGFFRSLQFTSLNGLAFADIDRAQMSRASTMSTMGQQLAQSIGIGMAATLLHLSLAHSHTHKLTAALITPTFLVIGGVALISTLFFITLPKSAGAELHGAPRSPRLRTA